MSATTISPTTRRVPPLGAFNLKLMTIELKRMLRNRRTVMFTLVLPVILYLFIGTNGSYANEKVGNGNVSAYILISMAVYGAVLSSTSGGAMVATERAQGWSRQLRLTPLSPVAYVAVKAVVALTLGAASVIAVNVIGAFNGKATMPTHVWVAGAIIAWIGSIVFGAFGLFMGYLLPVENVMQILGPSMALLAFIGGLFSPIDSSTIWGKLSELTPMYGLAQLARWPLMSDSFNVIWIVNIVVWLAIFVGGAAWRMSKDTARV